MSRLQVSLTRLTELGMRRGLKLLCGLRFEKRDSAVAALIAGVSFAATPAAAHPLMADPVDYPLVSGFDRFYAPEDDDSHITTGGVLLLNELKCVSCHDAPDAWKERLPGRAKLSLAGVGSRLSEDDLWLFIRSPQHRKKGTTMPGLFSGEDRDDTAMEAIVKYLGSLKTEVKKYPSGDVERGRKLYHTIGCVACHEPAKIEDYRPAEAPPDVAVEQPGLPSVPVLFADRYDRDSLVAFLLDPLKTRLDGRMPSTQMTEQEAADVAAYLQINREPLDAKERKILNISAPTVEEGKKAFAKMNCVACHQIDPSPTVAEKRGPKLVSLKTDRGCLSAKKKAGVPDYGLNDFQKKALKLALAKVKAEPKPEVLPALERTDAFLMRMNCYACHEWRGTGGLEEPRGQYLTCDPAAHSLGEIGRLPPKLDIVGRKITQPWFEKLLWGEDGGVRTHMTARMPRFGRTNVESLIPMLVEASQSEQPVTMDTSGLLKHQRGENGRVLMGIGKGGLGCVSCHGLKDRKSLGVPVINLTQTVKRIQPGYFKELLLNPQVTQPGTLMPPLFAGHKKANDEIEQVWTYLKEIDQSRLPEGLLQTGDYELKPEKEGKPVVFRTFLEGAGMHAVAVGFPQQLHVAFDALESRWAIAWKGRFLDAMTTWEERAMTPAKPLGEALVTMPLRMPLAKLTSEADTWPEACGTAAGYVFRGYRTSKDGTPAFLYEIGGMKVEDQIKPGPDGKSLHRVFTVHGAADGWFFMGLSPKATPVKVTFKDGVAVMEETISL